MKQVISIFITVFLLASCGNSQTQQSKAFIKKVDVKTFKELVDAGKGIILDVRTPEEVADGYINNASTINVYSPPVTRHNLAYPLITKEMGRAKKEATEQLTKRCAEISDAYGIRCQSLVMTGNPVDEINGQAAEGKMDMIIMGTEGASGIDKVLFGSNTASVIERAPCPVLAVPSHTKLAVPSKIVFATDYQDNDMQTLQALTKLVAAFKAELIIVHVSKEKLPARPTEKVQSGGKSDRDLIEQFSKAVAKETGLPQPYYYVMPHDNIQKGIELFVDSAGADLFALSTSKRTVFEKLFDASLTKKMAYQARLPLLAFHSAKVDEAGNRDDL